jgi:hypothetical protein
VKLRRGHVARASGVADDLPFRSLPAYVTTPSAAARTGSPSDAAMLMPSLRAPLAVRPNSEIT